MSCQKIFSFMKMWKSDNFIHHLKYRSITNTISHTTNQTNQNQTNSANQTITITHNNITDHIHASILIKLLSSGGGGGGDGDNGSSIIQPDDFQVAPGAEVFKTDDEIDDDEEIEEVDEEIEEVDDEEIEEVEVMLIQTDDNNVNVIPLSEFESEDEKKAEEKMQEKIKNATKIGLGTAIKTKGGKLLIKAADSIATNVIPAAKIAGQSSLTAVKIAGQVAVPTAKILGNAALNLTTNVVIPVSVAVAKNVVVPAIVHGASIIADLVIQGVSWSLYALTSKMLGSNYAESYTTKPLTLRKRNVLNTLSRLQEAQRFMGDDLWNSLAIEDPGHFQKGFQKKPGFHRAESMYRAIHTLKDIQDDSKSQETITKTLFNCDCLPKKERFAYDCKCTDEVTSLPQVMINEKLIPASLMAWKRVRTFQPYNRRLHNHPEGLKIISRRYKALATNIQKIAEQLESEDIKKELSKISKQIQEVEKLRSHYNKDKNHILPPYEALVLPLTSKENKSKEEDDNIEFVMQQVRHAISDILDERAIPRIEGLNKLLQDCVTQYLINETKEEEKEAIKPNMSGKVLGKGKPSDPNVENIAKFFLEARKRKKI
jgi:hypothetical protein